MAADADQMKGADEAGERIGRSARDRALRRIEAAARDVLPTDVMVESGEAELRLIGHRLSEQAVTDPRLRAFGMLVKELAR
jgi:hypothetical protein